MRCGYRLYLTGKAKKKGIRAAEAIHGGFLLFRQSHMFENMLGCRLREDRTNSVKDLLHEVLLLGGQWRIARGVSADDHSSALYF